MSCEEEHFLDCNNSLLESECHHQVPHANNGTLSLVNADFSHPLSSALEKMSSYQRDVWMLHPESSAMASIPISEFVEYYNPEDAIPDRELERALLFAGTESFGELQDYTYQRLEQFFKSMGIDNYPYHFTNIDKAMHIVEELMESMPPRRTGEPAVSHIYRNVLRMIEFIEGYNNIYRDYGDPPIFTPDIAEFYICATAMHDFLEDYTFIPGVGYHRGGCEEIRKSEFQQWEHGAHFYRALAVDPGSHIEDKLTEITLDFGDERNDMFVSTLLALKSDHVHPGDLMNHLEGTVDELQDRYDQSVIQNQLLSLAAYVIKCGDRLDNNATYLYSRDTSGNLIPTEPSRVYRKANENLHIFSGVIDVLKRIANHQQLTNEQLAEIKPFYLKYDPARWGKLVLAGMPIQKLYRANEMGKGIARII